MNFSMDFEDVEKDKTKKMRLCGPSISTNTSRKEGSLQITLLNNKPYSKYIEIGRIAYIARGKDSGKICAIVDVIDQNRALVDGPLSGVSRQAVLFKHLHLTKFRIKFPHEARTGTIKKAWTKANVSEKWAETSWARKLANEKLKALMTDYDRFKLMKAKQARNRILKRECTRLKLVAKKKNLKKPKKLKISAKKIKAEKRKAKLLAKKNEAKKGEGKRADAKKGEAKKSDAKKGEGKKGDVKKGEAKKGDGKKGKTKKDDTKKDTKKK